MSFIVLVTVIYFIYLFFSFGSWGGGGGIIGILRYVARIGAPHLCEVGEIRADLEPSASSVRAVKIAPNGISHQPFHCINTCKVTITEIAPNCVEIGYRNSRQHHAMFHQLSLAVSLLFRALKSSV